MGERKPGMNESEKLNSGPSRRKILKSTIAVELALTTRDAGINLAFLSGNSVWGVVPLLPSDKGQPHRIMRREGVFLGENSRKCFTNIAASILKIPRDLVGRC